MNFVEVTINGLKIRFPSKPYPSQICMMDKITRGLQKKQNCLLESPTGSGKTLALLCAALAWQLHERKLLQNSANKTSNNYTDLSNCYCNCVRINKMYDDEKPRKPSIQYEDDSEQPIKKQNPDCMCSCHGMYMKNIEIPEPEAKKIPTIYFATRTHKQIANVVKELKKTHYAREIQMTILSSRQHTCIHPEVSRMPNKNEKCKELIKSKNDNNNPNNEKKEINFDGGCSYLNRWKKNPIIHYDMIGVKEPCWDIEDLISSSKKKRICPYYAARDLASIVDIIFCPYNYLIDPRIRSSMGINLNEQIVILDEAHNIEDTCRDCVSFLITQAQLEASRDNLQYAMQFVSPEVSCECISFFGNVFDRLSAWIERNQNNVEIQNFDGSVSKIWTGLEIVAEFKMQGIGPENLEVYKQRMGEVMGEEFQEYISDGVRTLVEHLFLLLEFLYKNNHEFMEDYKVAITKTKVEDSDSENPDGITNTQSIKKFTQKEQKWTHAIHFWCLNPSVAFDYLRQCHSIILCSGTLSPLETFQSELGVKFDHQLEANHVIKDKQVWVGSLGYGPTDTNLLATFKNVNTYAFQDEIGLLVLDVCKKVPYGVLCFVPSYSMMTNLLNRWNQNGTSEKLQAYKKIFTESKIAKSFNELLDDFYYCIDSSSADEKPNGALLLAVYRGRASEGLDFSDNYARAVIAIGIPYPNVKDVQVDLKRKYNNTLCTKKKLLNGDEWYEIQAYRAVNQALGRCIRHKNDWGAIILVDDRYFRQPQKYSKGLSKWIRQKYHTYRNYTDAMKSLENFSTTMLAFKPEAEPVTQIDTKAEIPVEITNPEKENISLVSEVQRVNRNTVKSDFFLAKPKKDELKVNVNVNPLTNTPKQNQKKNTFMTPESKASAVDESPSSSRKRNRSKSSKKSKEKSEYFNEDSSDKKNLTDYFNQFEKQSSSIIVLSDDDDDFKNIKKQKNHSPTTHY